MFLLVEFNYRQTNSLDDENIIFEDKVLVEAPEGLKQFEFEDFVFKNYFIEICNIIQYSNLNDFIDIHNIQIDKVSLPKLIQKFNSVKNKL